MALGLLWGQGFLFLQSFRCYDLLANCHPLFLLPIPSGKCPLFHIGLIMIGFRALLDQVLGKKFMPPLW